MPNGDPYQPAAGPAGGSQEGTVTELLRWIGVWVLGVVITVFAVQNDEAVRLTFLGLQTPALHLAVLLALAILAGALLTALVGLPAAWRWRTRLHQLQARTAPPPEASSGSPSADRLSAAPGEPPGSAPEA